MQLGLEHQLEQRWVWQDVLHGSACSPGLALLWGWHVPRCTGKYKAECQGPGSPWDRLSSTIPLFSPVLPTPILRPAGPHQ